MKIWVCLIGLVGSFFALSALADTGLRVYEEGRRQYFSSKNISNGQAKELGMRQAASDLRKFLDNFPNHPKAPDALFNVGSIFLDLVQLTGDRDAATRSVHYFKELVAKYPKHRLADDALYQIASICKEVFQDQKCVDDAYRRILGEYAGGDMAIRIRPAPAVNKLNVAELAFSGISRTSGEMVLSFRLTEPRALRGKTLSAEPAQKIPARFFLDLEKARLSSDANSVVTFEPGEPFSRLRFGANAASLRVVVDLAPGTPGERVSLVPSAEGFEIHVPRSETTEKEGEKEGDNPPPENEGDRPPAIETAKPAITVTEKSTQSLEDGTVISVKQSGKRRVILDAGHGGEDVGAKGKHGTQEKDICLSIVKNINELLRTRPDYEVFLTRNDDRFVPLAERTRMANIWNGELFVSVHANASRRHGAEGVSTYFLNNSDDEEAALVEKRENAQPGTLMSDDPKLTEAQYLEIMKASMVKNFHTVQSTEFAQNVQTSLVHELRGQFSGVTDLGVKSARFFVLTGAQMPAILIETSFISNSQEERRLADQRYQRAIAKAVVKGVDEFFKSSVGRGDHAALFQR